MIEPSKKIVFLSSFCNESHYKFEAHIINMVMSIFQEKEFIFIGHKKHVLKTLSLVTKKDKIRLILDKSENAKECFLFTLKK